KSVDITRLNKRLDECFISDRSFWAAQKRLSIPARGSPNPALQVRPLSEILSSTQKFWFSHCARMQNAQSIHAKGTQTFIVFSEPLFFFSKTLRGYFRFLDVNHEGTFGLGDIEKLVKQAKAKILRAIPKEIATRGLGSFIEGLDLVPTRNYIPAGDS